MYMTHDDVIEYLRQNSHMFASDLLNEADPKFAKRFKRIDKAICELLKDVKRHFPDTMYYTASGGFHLLIGQSHIDEISQNEVSALCGNAQIGDGDW